MKMDEKYMQLAINLARQAQGQTSPNPLVGAVIVKDGEIIGMGAHLKAGTAHAEVHALSMAGENARGATIYVSLEPCNHQGRTGACTHRLIEAGIARVYVAALDPNPLVAGKGVEALRQAGIEVVTGILADEARDMNTSYNKYIVTRKPYILLKAAMTLDGKIATKTGDSKWITNASSRQHVHEIRNQLDAIMVGSQTVIADDPLLTTRLPQGGKNPIRIVLDSKLSLPLAAKLLDTKEARTIIATTGARDEAKASDLEDKGVEVLICKDKNGQVDLEDCLAKLGELGITSILVEGGSELHGAFLGERLFDEVMIFIAPKLIGGREGKLAFAGEGFDLMKEAVELDDIKISHFDGDICLRAKRK